MRLPGEINDNLPAASGMHEAVSAICILPMYNRPY